MKYLLWKLHAKDKYPHGPSVHRFPFGSWAPGLGPEVLARLCYNFKHWGFPAGIFLQVLDELVWRRIWHDATHWTPKEYELILPYRGHLAANQNLARTFLYVTHTLLMLERVPYEPWVVSDRRSVPGD